jgi:outer membrane protein
MKFFLPLFLCFWIGMTPAQEKLTFEQVIDLALRKNHQIEVARNNALLSNNNATLGNADLLPRASLAGGATFTNRDGDGTTTTNASLSANYTLFDGFGNVYRYKSLRSGSRIGRLDARDLIESTLLSVSEAYYSAASSWENYQIARELLSISRERLERAEKRSAFGQAMSIDVLSARVDLNSDSVTVTQSRFIWDEARRGLNIFLNREVEAWFTIDTAVVFHPGFDLDDMQSKALARNAGYLSSQERVRQAKYDLNAARSSHMPKLDLSASYGLSQTSSDLAMQLNDPSKTTSAGASLSFSLFNGWKTHIQRQNARIALKTEEILWEQSRLNLEKDVISAYEAWRNSLQVLELEKRSMEAAELNFQRTQELYQMGQVTTTQFREAQLNLIQAKSDLSVAKYDAKLNEIELLRLSGGLVREEALDLN